MTSSPESEHSYARYCKTSADIKEVSKCAVRYMKMGEFRLGASVGYICYNCKYFMKPDHCLSLQVRN
jgi:hypothetical protein